MAQEIADSKLIDTWSSDGLKVKPDISKIIEGWQLGEQPPHEYMNWLQNTFGSKLNHILKNGVPLWNNETPYLAGSIVQHNGSVWICKTTNTNSEPTDSNNNWDKIPTLENLALTVDTINDFPTSATTGDTCIVKDLDRGGIFIYDSTKVAEDNQGTNFNGWIRQYSGAVNVKWFGAKGDGATDDTVAIQNAITYCINNNFNLYITNGIYGISSTILCQGDNYKSIQIFGENRKNTFFKDLSDNGVLMFDFNPNKTNYWQHTNYTLANITIDGTSKPLSKGLELYYNHGIKVDNCEFKNLGTVGIKMTGCVVSVIEKTDFTNITNKGIEYFATLEPFMQNTEARVRDCWFNDMQYGIYCNSGSTILFLDNTIFQPCSTAGLYNSGSKAYLNSVYFEDCRQDFIMEGTATQVMENCFFGPTHGQYLDVPMIEFLYQTTAPGRYAMEFYSCSIHKKATQATAPLLYAKNINTIYMDENNILNTLHETCYTENNTLLQLPQQLEFRALPYLSRFGLKVSANSGVSTVSIDGLPNPHAVYSDLLIKNRESLLETGRAIVRIDSNIISADLYALEVKQGINSMAFIRTNGVGVFRGVEPQADNAYALGAVSARWGEIYAASGTINTSDDREKTYIDITEVEKQVALELKANMKKFKFNDAIKEKGEDKARIHFGASAQTVKTIFENYGLNAFDYALLCYDEWDTEYERVVDTEAVLDENGNIVKEATYKDGTIIKEAGNRYGIRYEELLCFIMSAL